MTYEEAKAYYKFVDAYVEKHNLSIEESIKLLQKFESKSCPKYYPRELFSPDNFTDEIYDSCHNI